MAGRSKFLSVIVLAGLVLPFVGQADAADVEITSNTPGGVNLDSSSGTTVHVAPGVTVGPANPAIEATTQPWSLTNDGSLSGSSTVRFTKGGNVVNTVGATITSTNSSVILGVSGTGGVGTVTNAGTITGVGDTVLLYGGGTVTNLATGTITASSSSNAVSISGGTSRTVINDGLISNTGSGNATGILLQGAGATNTIINNASGRVVGGFNGVYTSATAVLSLTNLGSIASTRGSAVEATLGGTIVNSGTIASAQSNGVLTRNTAAADITNSGTISGAVNAINFTATGGGSTGATHTVRLLTGSVLNGNVLGGTGTDNLILNGTGSESIAKFSNFETLTMQGGDWTVTGAGVFSTSTTVQGGRLRVDGQLTTPGVDVQAGGTLSGGGTVVGTVTNRGNVQVDSGVFTINGNYVHQVGAQFTVGVTPSGAGLLAVTGAGHTATVNGGNVNVQAILGPYALNTTYTILTASGGRSGTFDGATSNFAFLAPTLSYDANNVYLSLARNSIDFGSLGGTPNQTAAGHGVEALGLGSALFNAALILTPEQARAAFDAVSGEIHASLRSQFLNDSIAIREAIWSRQRSGVFSGAAQTASRQTSMNYADARGASLPAWPVKAPAALPFGAPIYAAWAQGYGSWSRVSGDGNAATLRGSSGGAIAGFDVTFADGWRVGLAAGGGHSEARVDARASSASVDTFHLAGYGDKTFGNVALRAGVAYAHHAIETNRAISFPGFSDVTGARYDASTIQGFGEAAYWLGPVLPGTELFANLAHVRVHSGSFAENGGAAALTVAPATTESTFSTLGARVEAPLPVPGAWTLIAKGSLAWQHAFDAAAPLSAMVFAGNASSFLIAGVPIARDAMLAEAGLGVALRRDTTLALSYASRLASDVTTHAVKANLTIRF